MRTNNNTILEGLTLETPFVINEQDNNVNFATGKLHKLKNLAELEELQRVTKNKVFFQLPFCLAGIENGSEVNGNEPILAMEVENEIKLTKEQILELLPENKIVYSEIKTDINDENFGKIVEKIKQEISNGEVCQTIISREFNTVIENFSISMLLSIYKKLLSINGSYMTFLFNSGEETITGASPEVHLKIQNGTATKVPIAGTMAKKDISDFFGRLMLFLDDKKEENELLMVTDEELKMMMQICDLGEISPIALREIGKVIHTEIALKGELKKDISIIDALRKTLYSPTLVGGPLQNAFSMIKKYEQSSRKYYGGAFGYLDNEEMDSCITIRSANISHNGELSVRAGAGIVADSEKETETDETTNKANGFFSILGNNLSFESFLGQLNEEQKKVLEQKLDSRMKNLSKFHLFTQNESLEVKIIMGKEFVIINNGDNFVYMLEYMIKRMGGITKIIDNKDFDKDKIENQIVVLGPGPGNINDMNDEKMINLLKIVDDLNKNDRKILGICLGHQAICKQNGIKIEKQEKTTQGVQKEINIFSNTQTLGFYNSFSPLIDNNNYNDENRNIYQYDKNYVSMQFHPESIMSVNGFEILKESIIKLIKK